MAELCINCARNDNRYQAVKLNALRQDNKTFNRTGAVWLITAFLMFCLVGCTEKTPLSNYADGSTFRDSLSGGGQGPEMVVVPAGSFLMGSPANEAGRFGREGPQRTVTISKPFAVGTFEVTWSEWEECVADKNCDGSMPDSEGGDEGWGKDNRPVINVSWEDAQAYTAWLSQKTGHDYRLLSEAEWEYAARAGTTTPYSTGDTITTRDANFVGDKYIRSTVLVGSYAANAFGLYDMHGNVYEWVEDCWNSSSYSGAPDDGSAWRLKDCSVRIVRGGSWYSGRSRSAYRVWWDTSYRSYDVGFRIARAL